MRKFGVWILVGSLAAIGFVGVPSLGQGPKKAARPAEVYADTPDALKGLKAVVVDADLERHLVDSTVSRVYGINDARLIEAATNTLRQKGIQVLPAYKLSESPGTPLLDIEIVPAGSAYEHMVTVKLREGVRLQRAPATLLFGAVTWESSHVALDAQRGITVMEVLESRLSAFCDAWQKANKGR